jgi:hypothetical protein
MTYFYCNIHYYNIHLYYIKSTLTLARLGRLWYNSVFVVLSQILRDLPQVSTTTTVTNFKLHDSCVPYMGMQQKV